MKIRCLLVDDEPPALQVLQSHIKQIKGLEIVGMCSNALDAMEVLHRSAVDLLFLDIKMPKIIGTDFLRSLSQPPKVIFVTAYREYAVDGFELEAVDYLMKPVSFERFLKAINRLKNTPDERADQKSFKANPNAFIYLKIDRVRQKIFLEEILYVESLKDYVTIHFTNGHKVQIKQTISAIENLLSEHMFLRVHRSFLVSLNKISGYCSSSLHLGNAKIPIGRLYKQNVTEHIQVI